MDPLKSSEVLVARSVRANRGDLANQLGLVNFLLQNKAIKKIYVSSYYPEHFKNIEKVVTLKPSLLRGYTLSIAELKILKKGTPIFWGGGIDIQDSGSKIKLLLILLRFILLTLFKNRLIVSFQGIGPIRTKTGLVLSKLILNKVTAVITREQTALDWLDRLKYPEHKVFLSIDSALFIESYELTFGKNYLINKGFDIDKPIIAINLRRWYHQKGGWMPTQFSRKSLLNKKMSNIQKNFESALSHAAKLGYYQFVFLPMYLKEPEPWEDDIILAEQLQSTLPCNCHSRVISENISTNELCSILNNVTFSIGMRLHSTILTHTVLHPAIHIAYEHKGADYYKAINQESLLCMINEFSSTDGDVILKRKISYLHENYSNEVDKLVEKVNDYRRNTLFHVSNFLNRIEM